MGLLAIGTPLGWPETKQHAAHVRDWGIQQLIAIWKAARSKERDALLWGDEIEYLVVKYEHENRKVRVSLCQTEVLASLAKDKEFEAQGGCVPELQECNRVDPTRDVVLPFFHPEFGRYMLEATPGKPWGIDFRDLLDVERNMKWRRVIARKHMAPNTVPITMTTFPRLGVKNGFTCPNYEAVGDRSRSQFLPDEIINEHIRFPTLTANIRERRGRKVEINVPVFRDENTPWPWRDPTVDFQRCLYPEDKDAWCGAAKINHIYMDAMGFGMGSCCLQITFQAKNIDEGRMMYDQLSPLGPILLAMTAATPIYKGFLADTDVRWNQISASVDDRTAEELGEVPLVNHKWRIPKSRYASNSTYISQDPRLRPEYMDPELVVDPELKAKLTDAGMDDLLATHFAHLFIRDPLVIFSEDLASLDLHSAKHFENLQSTNWQHMRFKPPPLDQHDIGWRVEFRSMEIQMSDFENAAFSIFMVLLTRAILTLNLNLYLPIPRTHENMETAHGRDAVRNARFWFRRNPMPTRVRRENGSSTTTTTTPNGTNGMNGTDSPDSSPSTPPSGPVEDEYCLLTIDEIINGQKPDPEPQPPTDSRDAPSDLTGGDFDGDHWPGISSPPPPPFPGLVPLVLTYLSSMSITVATRCELNAYLNFIRDRASGKAWTPARWIRGFVRRHPEYEGDSIIGDGICYDLVKVAERLGEEDWSVGHEMIGL